MYYAQITNGIVSAVTQTAGPIDAPDMIEINGLLDIAGHGYDPSAGIFTPPPPAPAQVLRVTALQALLAIDAAGLATAYETWANDPSRTFAERAFIEKAQFWNRNDPVLIAAGNQLGLTSAQVDELFDLASNI